MMGARILVVEDQPIVAADLAAMVEELGCEVVGTAASAAEALRLAEQMQPELALMDIRLEGSPDGIETAKLLRKRLRLPVVYITAYTDAKTLERARQTEPLGYLPKPFSKAAMQATLAMAHFRAQAERDRIEESRWGRGVLDTLADAVLALDNTARIRFMNPVAEGFLGIRWADAQQQPIDKYLSAPDGGCWTDVVDRLSLAQNVGGKVSLLQAPNTSFSVWVAEVSENGVPIGFAVTLRARPLELLDVQLDKHVLLCAACKRVRDPTGNWVEIERFLLEQYHEVSSHGMCEACVRSLYPEFADDEAD